MEIGHKERAEDAQVEMIEQNRDDGVGGKCDQNRNHRRFLFVALGKKRPQVNEAEVPQHKQNHRPDHEAGAGSLFLSQAAEFRA